MTIGGNVVDKCLGKGFDEDKLKFHKGGQCARIANGNCLAYIYPALKWREGLLSMCPLATHYDETVVIKTKQRVGQQKQRKRG